MSIPRAISQASMDVLPGARLAMGARVAGCLAAGLLVLASAAKAAGPVLQVAPPTALTPMTINAVLTSATAAPGDSVSVLVGVRLMPGWHTYAKVPPDQPYVQTKMSLEPGPGLEAGGEWIAPPAVDDAHNPRLRIYQSQPEPLIFMHELRVAATASGEIMLRVAVRYQTCNIRRCLPPTRKVFDLRLKVAPPSARADL